MVFTVNRLSVSIQSMFFWPSVPNYDKDDVGKQYPENSRRYLCKIIFGVNQGPMGRYFVDDRPVAKQLGPVVLLKGTIQRDLRGVKNSIQSTGFYMRTSRWGDCFKICRAKKKFFFKKLFQRWRKKIISTFYFLQINSCQKILAAVGQYLVFYYFDKFF